jgi:hypothetical protein
VSCKAVYRAIVRCDRCGAESSRDGVEDITAARIEAAGTGWKYKTYDAKAANNALGLRRGHGAVNRLVLDCCPDCDLPNSAVDAYKAMAASEIR